MPVLPPTGDAPLWDCYTIWKPNWNAKSPPNGKPPSKQALDDYQPLCDIAAWPCIAIIATPRH